jgi:hypothetical protein
MNPILRSLDDIASIMECAALDYLGCAKAELGRLCEHLDKDRDYDFDGNADLSVKLREVLACYVSGNKMDGTTRLIQISRSLWLRVHAL